MECKVGLIIPSLHINQNRETVLVNRYKNQIYNTQTRVFISTNDLEDIIHHFNRDYIFDFRSELFILYNSSSDTDKILSVSTVSIHHTLNEREIKVTTQSNALKKQNVTLWFLKEHLDALQLKQDQIIYFDTISTYRVPKIEHLILSNTTNDNEDHSSLFLNKWSIVGIQPDLPLTYPRGEINLFQRTGKITTYRYKIVQQQTLNSNLENQLNQLSIQPEDGLENRFMLVSSNTTYEYVQSDKISNIDRDKEIGALFGHQYEQIRNLIKTSFRDEKALNRLKKMNIQPIGSLLIHGPPSCGKSTMIDLISKEFNINKVMVNFNDIHKYQPTSKGMILKHNQAKYESAMMIIDQIDEIFPETGDSSRSRQELNGDQLTTVFLDMIQSAYSNGIFIVGITSKLPSLSNYVTSQFDEIIKILPPTLSERVEIFKYYLSQGDIVDVNSQHNLQVIQSTSEDCNGYMGGDISTMCRDAILQLMKRSKGCTSPPMLLEKDDFINPYGLFKNNTKTILSKMSPSSPKIRWVDIGGLELVKKSLKEMVIWDYHYGDSIKRLGIQTSTGILLYGPPGTGKTMLASACAHEAKANFISVNIADVVQGDYGESEKILSELFKTAILNAPCVVFIDEIQSIFGHKETTGSHGRKLISQLLIELDEINIHNRSPNASKTGKVMLLAATNLPQAIDKSFLRPGRFDKLLYVEPPNNKDRLAILEGLVKKNNIKLDSDVDLSYIADITLNYTGSDLNGLLKKSGIYTIQRDMKADCISKLDIFKVIGETTPTFTYKQMKLFEDWEKSRLEKFKNG
ncbi:putative ATPase [Tieghemostelium lacteum]|uniref:Putative ATPase n=1 Tax=Tieghemostelium lacteum TaxID=361077 RepID=A0A151ZBA8_TIELA|nr:putative ATPase [Tieghemostelium lacteum]|eukprot:KYQ91221.1 putative ATPase [Tieghemostelium lacteum]